MGFTNIWSFSIEHSDSITVEIFSGQNKFTREGLFSGPLRRQEISSTSGDETIQFMFSLGNVAQTGKNKFVMPLGEACLLFDFLAQRKFNSAYCFLLDKKLHHINAFVSRPCDAETSCFCTYSDQTGILYYPSDMMNVDEDACIVTIPRPKLFLNAEDKYIRGFLVFSYCGHDVPANTSRETIQLSSETIYRNLQYERNVQTKLYSLGGQQSVKNEITFPQKKFFAICLPSLCKLELDLYWGKERQKISKSAILCHISYKNDWFIVSGGVTREGVTYTLSELLASSKGKSYVKIDDGILFLPDELRKIASSPSKDGEIHVPQNQLAAINQVAEYFHVDPSSYLDKFLNFSNSHATLSSQINGLLRPYQQEGVAWILTLYKNGFGGCLADDMGLGKTFQTIAFLACKERKTNHPVLIVVPKIVLYNWKNELMRFAPEMQVVLTYGKFEDIETENVIYLTTYETLANQTDRFANIRFDTIVLDESQYVKNYRTQRYQAITCLRSNFMLALSGTPIENSIEELWSLLNLLNPGLLGTHHTFMRKFSNAHTDQGQLSILRKIVSPFILRRTKESVLCDLPPKEEHYVYCEMSEEQCTLYNTLFVAAQNELASKPSRYTIKDNSIILQALLYLREACSDPQLLPVSIRGDIPSESCKFELFKEYATRIVCSSGKVIVYSLFPRVLQRLQIWCAQQGWKTFYIDGATTNRQGIVDSFENSSQGVFLISLKAGGVGLNLVSCQDVIIYEPWWNSAAERQAADRIYRIGQVKPVSIYHFLVKDTIEEKIYELQQKKDAVSSGVLEKMDRPGRISMEDIYHLLF